MNKGYLSQYFEGVGAKRLTTVEVDPGRSNQHEFQGAQKLRDILGRPADKVTYPARFVRLGNSEEDRDSITAFVTWSDVRRGNPNRSAEYHLYYSAEAASVVHQANAGDLLIVCRQKNSDELLIVMAPAGSTIENQLMWLFDLPLESFNKAVVKEFGDGQDRPADFSVRHILEALDIEVEDTDDNWLDRIIERFGHSLPSTALFSNFARETLQDVDPLSDPDATLLAWMEQEELLFRTFERYIVGQRISQGFIAADGEPDVDEFVSFSLSVQNRRKARVGRALENHLEVIFQTNNVQYSRGAQTENRAKPDFLFPGPNQYQDPSFPDEKLKILGVKSTCKDRWRQVLSEAKRIKTKHLLTLEPGISENQTEEMQANHLQLVIPSAIQTTYRAGQQEWLLSIQEFISLTQ